MAFLHVVEISCSFVLDRINVTAQSFHTLLQRVGGDLESMVTNLGRRKVSVDILRSSATILPVMQTQGQFSPRRIRRRRTNWSGV